MKLGETNIKIETGGVYMSEKELGVIEDTLFVPMLGRIYASEHCNTILYDAKALELKQYLPKHVVENDHQTQYTYLASANRSANMDRYIRDFLKRKKEGIIVQLGIGLETTFNRNDNGHTLWYGVDLEHVIEYRRNLIPESEREHYIRGDAFAADWIKEIRTNHPSAPLLVIASGLFYYFTKEEVIKLIQMLETYGDIELIFDCVNKSGMLMMQKKHMKSVGHEDAKMFFYVDSAKELAKEISNDIRVLAEEKYYAHTITSDVTFSTKMSMWISDALGMVKMVHLGL